MENLTLIIPAKNESESLPIFLNELKKYKYKKMIILQKDDIKTIESLKGYDEVEIFGKLTFFGKSIEKKINSKIKLEENQILLSGKFDVILSDFKVNLPSFLGVKIDDIIKISFKIEVNKNEI